ncbi:protein SCAF11 isoform X1 [Oncorhynchus kisutch]|uniref:protein SCAF11 isoform X1 n=1 Tax=Oncorhynchus kisutch TaxID=8019 RepID=UPI0009A07683|nr:protein SCAF11 isoform X1 [Oncorhynchus kisutch]XP_020346417.1 protein SCAF11 isoform X1 [Oncorhynchus kisutch]
MTGESGNDGQTPEGDPEPEEAERCPICLGALARCVLAMPDSCCHLFCLSCLLRWAELQAVPSCPVDRQPFNVVYKRDAVLGCVTVPVKKRVSQSEPEKCGCTDPEASGCLLKKQGGRSRRTKTERTSEAKVKGLIRKCSDDDPSLLSKKKVRGPLCSWSAAQTGTAMGTMTQCIAEPLWVPEEEPEDDCKQCSRKTQDCPFLPVAVPVSASGNSRQLFHPSEWSSSPFPLRPLSPFSTIASPLSSGHFVFQGRVCAVTCSKGEEKKGTCGSGSKGPSKQTEALTTRRSGRHSRAEEQAPTQDPASSQSHSSDSDTSTNPPTKAGKSTAAAGKRKGKRAAQRKPSAKRKAPARKKASKVVLSSPTGSEEEEEAKEEEELEQQRKEVEEREQLSDTAVSPQAVQRTSSPTEEDGRPEPSACDALKDQPCEDDDLSEEENCGKEEEDGEEEDQKSPSSDVELNTPGLSPDRDQGAGEKHPDQIEDPEKSNSPTSSNSPERPLESPQSGQSGQLGEEDADAVEATADPTEVKSDDEASVEEEKAEASPCLTAEPESCAGSTRCDSPDGNASQKVSGASEAKVSEEDRHDPKDVINEKPAAGSKEDGLSEDDTEAIPIDCDSPSSECSTNLASDPPKETESAAHESTSQALEDKRNGSRQERESSVGEEKVEERKNGRQRKSRFHSAATTWSPKRESKQDSSRRSRSRSRERNKERQASGSPPSSRSRERDAERDAPRMGRSRDHSRERKNRKRSKSRSRSSSRSRNRSYRRGSSPERPDSGGQSPRKRNRWTGDGWRPGPGSDSSRRNFPERPARDTGRTENGGFADVSPSRENPDWVMEKARADTEARVTSGPRWEDKSWCGDRGRGTGRGRGAYGTSNQQGEQAENRWQPRNTFSGTSNNSGSDAYSRFNENRGGRRKEPEMGESMMDRSGWSSASSWAVRRTLPADVQNYYSRRDRGGGAGSGSWSRQEETSTADPAQSETNAQPNAQGEAPPALNVMPPQMNILHYPMGPRGPPVSLQPPPFGMPPQVPMHHHSSVPLLQVPVTAAQGLPPPPPPPPPMQQGSMTAIQADSRTTQMMSSMAGHGKAPFMPTMTKVGGATTAQAHSMAMPSSTTQHSRAAPPDSSKKEKKQQIHERAVNEVKAAMKPYYQNKDITKDEYKEIVRKAVEKVCHSKSGEVNSGKVANLVKAYVDKYKHARKK